MRHPITGRRISREKYAEEEAAFAKRISEMKAEEQTKEQEALAKYRVKSAAMVHKASGDPAEQVCKDGLQVFDALSPARERANKTAKHE